MAKKFKFSRFLGNRIIDIEIPIRIRATGSTREYVEADAPDDGYYITGEFEELREIDITYRIDAIEAEIMKQIAPELEKLYPGYKVSSGAKALVGLPLKMSTKER